LIFQRFIPEAEDQASRPVVVVGAGLLGLQVAEQIVAHGDPVVLVDPDVERIQRVQERGFEAVMGDADRYDVAVEPYLNRAKTLVCILSDIERNYRVCERARTTFGIDHIVTRITDPGVIDRFDKLGVTTMNAAMDQAVLLGLLVRNPSAYELLTRTDDDKEVCEVAVHNPLFLNKPLRQVAFPGDLLVLAIRRQGELVVPHGDTRLYSGDQITLVGACSCVEITREMMTA
jgi:Trk K+ transport system NAD-binding subunit